MLDSVEPRALIQSNRHAFWIPGFAVASWGPFIPYIKERFQITEDNLGLLLMCMAVGAGISIIVANSILNRFGCRTIMRLSGCAVALCLALVTVIPNIYLLGLVLFCFGLVCECGSIAANVNAGALERHLKRNLMSGLHGIYSLGNCVGVVTVAFFLGTGLDFVGSNLLLTSCVASIAVILYSSLIGCRNLLDSVRGVDGAVQDGSSKGPFITRTLFLLGAVCFLMFMVEGSMLDWTGVFLTEVKQIALHEAGYGYAAFATAMTICRLLGDRTVASLGRRRVLALGSLLAFIGISCAVLSPNPWGSILSFGIVGIGAANLVPQSVSYAATVRSVPLQRSIVIVNAIGYIGGLLGPALIGFVAHYIGLANTFFMLAGMTLLVSVICVITVRSGNIAEIVSA